MNPFSEQVLKLWWIFPKLLQKRQAKMLKTQLDKTPLTGEMSEDGGETPENVSQKKKKKNKEVKDNHWGLVFPVGMIGP